MNISMDERHFLLKNSVLYFKNCHASTIVALPTGDFLSAFFAGEREGAGDTAIWLSRFRSGKWIPPERLFAEDGLAHWNPVLYAEGDRVWIFYKVGPTVHEWTTRWASSTDGGETWTPPRPLVPGDSSPRGPVKNKMIVLSNGDWIAPGSVETEQYWDAFVDSSSDRGNSWRRTDVPLEHRPSGAKASGDTWQGLQANALWETDLDRVFKWDGVIQPTLWESAPGQVHMLLRSTRGRIYRSDSRDFGKSWSPAFATTLPNNNSGIDIVQMTGHRLVLALNPIEGNWGSRSPISLVSSTDNGETWSDPVHMETEEGEFSYPAIIARGNELHVAYTWNRKNIVYRRMTVQ
ncbi:exo-alpha-sialidase [Telmatospirillum sp.]|uniref:sialidase family protein n=1 Tax=Telmatospirillum sp. TaxID=2079197 RepID=UPI002842A6D1|nr:exo-alpha-sialidase [Telmatospirillum sp.]MDR3437038.1 exo-alpha-sialidase [Telmatospirillum sp.]